MPFANALHCFYRCAIPAHSKSKQPPNPPMGATVVSWSAALPHQVSHAQVLVHFCILYELPSCNGGLHCLHSRKVVVYLPAPVVGHTLMPCASDRDKPAPTMQSTHTAYPILFTVSRCSCCVAHAETQHIAVLSAQHLHDRALPRPTRATYCVCGRETVMERLCRVRSVLVHARGERRGVETHRQQVAARWWVPGSLLPAADIQAAAVATAP